MVAVDKTSVHENYLHFYTLAMSKWKLKFKKYVSFSISSKSMNHLWINLAKGKKDTKTHKPLLREMKADRNKRRYIPCSWNRQTNTVKVTIPSPNPKSKFQQAFCRNWQTDGKIHMEMHKTQRSQNEFEKQLSWRITLLTLRLINKVTIIKTTEY